MKINFRPATSADIPLLRAFEQKLVAHERTIEPTLKPDGILEYYDIPKLIEDKENTLVLIAEVDGQPIGCGFGQIRAKDSCYTKNHNGYIGLVYIDEAHRGHNYSGKLMDTLRKWFKTKNINEIVLQVYSGNTGAIKAYEKYGFTPYSIILKIEN